MFCRLAFRYVGLSLCYVDFSFRYASSSLCYVNLLFRYVDLPNLPTLPCRAICHTVRRKMSDLLGESRMRWGGRWSLVGQGEVA